MKVAFITQTFLVPLIIKPPPPLSLSSTLAPGPLAVLFMNLVLIIFVFGALAPSTYSAPASLIDQQFLNSELLTIKLPVGLI